MIRIISLAAVVLAAAPAIAQQQPAKPERGLVSVGYGSDFGIFIETPLANPGPKVEAWSWLIRKAPKQIPGAIYDMTVSRELIDCAGWTRTQLYANGFLGEAYLGRSPGEGGTTPLEGANEAAAKIVCGRIDVSKDAPIADIAAARALTAAHFQTQ